MPEERGTANDLEPRFYPNLIGRLYLISLEDVMGRNGVNALLNLSGARNLVNSYPPSNLKREFPFAELTTISKATETMYGPRGARGMELRAGRYAFNLGLKEFGPLLGMDDLALKLMPMTMKMKIALNATAQTFDRLSDQPCCHLAQGILEEALTWVTGGHSFHMEEIECRALGSPSCIFAIDKDAID